MTTELAFPKLGIELHLNRLAFSIGPLNVYWYGIIVVSGIMLGYLYSSRRCNEFSVKKDSLSDYLLFSVVGGILGARIYYVAFKWDYYSQHLNEVFSIWKGGIAIYGGIIGALIVILVLSKIKKENPLNVTDCCVGGLILGQAIGRWGNFMNIEAFGCNTDSVFGMTSPAITSYLQNHMAELSSQGIAVDPMMPVHPTFFYESMWNLAAFIIIALFTKKRTFKGEITLLYLALYGMGRSWIEGLRTDSLMWGPFRVSQVLAIILTLFAIGVYLVMRKKQAAGTLCAYFALDESLHESSSENKEKAVEDKSSEKEESEKIPEQSDDFKEQERESITQRENTDSDSKPLSSDDKNEDK